MVAEVVEEVVRKMTRPMCWVMGPEISLQMMRCIVTRSDGNFGALTGIGLETMEQARSKV